MARKISTTLARLIPQAIEVKSGEDVVVVAGNAEENKILNYYLAAKARSLIDNNLERYKAQETLLTPRELRDVAGACRELAEFSATLYKEAEPLLPTEKVVEASEVPNFEKLKPIEEEPEPADDATGPKDNPLPAGS